MAERLKLIQITDLTTGVVTEERYLRFNRPHRDPNEGPAVTFRDAQTGVVTRESYRLKGKFHRDDGPAIICRDGKTGRVTQESHYHMGAPHRVDGPSSTTWDAATGEVVTLHYHLHGQLHRDPAEGPSFYSRDPGTGVVTSEHYEFHGESHRPDGPARISRLEDGRVWDVRYYVNGHLHRPAVEGPAVFKLSLSDGNVTEEWWEHGQRVAQPRSGMGSRPRAPGDRSPR